MGGQGRSAEERRVRYPDLPAEDPHSNDGAGTQSGASPGSIGGGTAILDALLAMVEGRALGSSSPLETLSRSKGTHIAAHASVSRPTESSDGFQGSPYTTAGAQTPATYPGAHDGDVSVDPSEGGPAETEVSIEHVRLAGATLPLDNRGGTTLPSMVSRSPEPVPFEPYESTLSTTPSSSPQMSEQHELNAVLAPSTRRAYTDTVSMTSPKLETAADVAGLNTSTSPSLGGRLQAHRMMHSNEQQRRGQQPLHDPPSLASTAAVSGSSNGSGINTRTLRADGQLQDAAAPFGGAEEWRSAFAANAQRLLYESQLQVQELLYYRKAYEAARRAHESDVAQRQQLTRELKTVREEQREERAAHEKAMAALSSEALELSRQVATLVADRDAREVRLVAEWTLRCEKAAHDAREAAQAQFESDGRKTEQAMVREMALLRETNTAWEAERVRLVERAQQVESRLARERERWRRRVPKSDRSDSNSTNRQVSQLSATVLADRSQAISETRSSSGGNGRDSIRDDSLNGAFDEPDAQVDGFLAGVAAARAEARTRAEYALLEHLDALARSLVEADAAVHDETLRRRRVQRRLRASEAALTSKHAECAQLVQEKLDLEAALAAAHVLTEEHAREDGSRLSEDSTHGGGHTRSGDAVVSLSRKLRRSRAKVAALEAQLRAQRPSTEVEERLRQAVDEAKAQTAARTRLLCGKAVHRAVYLDNLWSAGGPDAASAGMQEVDADDRGASDASETVEDFDLALSRLHAALASHRERESSLAEQLSSAATTAATIAAARAEALASELADAQRRVRETDAELAPIKAFAQTQALDIQELAVLLEKQRKLVVQAAREHTTKASAFLGGTGDHSLEGAGEGTGEASSASTTPMAAVHSAASTPASALIRTAQRTHSGLLMLLAATRESRADARTLRVKLREAKEEHRIALEREQNKVRSLEARITNLTKETRAAEAKRRGEVSALQDGVEQRLSALLAQVKAAEAERDHAARESESLRKQMRGKDERALAAESALAASQALLRDLTAEHTSFTESLRDVVAERDDLLVQRAGLMEAARALETAAARDHEGVLYLYALLTQWCRWTAHVMLRWDRLQLQKVWSRWLCRAAETELAAIRRMLAATAVVDPDGAQGSENGGCEDDDVTVVTVEVSGDGATAGWRSAHHDGGRENRGPRGTSLRAVGLAALAAVTLRRLGQRRRAARACQDAVTLPFGVTAAAGGNEESATMMAVTAGSAVSGRAPQGGCEANSGRDAMVASASPPPRGSHSGSPGGSVPRVVFFAHEATNTSRDYDVTPATATTIIDSTENRGDSERVEMAATAPPNGRTVPLVSVLSFPATLRLSGDRLREPGRLPEVTLPPLHEMLCSTAHIFGPTCTASSWDLVEYLLHAMQVRATKAAPGGSRGDSSDLSNRGIPRPDMHALSSTYAVTVTGTVSSVVNSSMSTEASLQRLLQHTSKLRQTAREHAKDVSLLAEQNRELGARLAHRMEVQAALERDMTALEAAVMAKHGADSRNSTASDTTGTEHRESAMEQAAEMMDTLQKRVAMLTSGLEEERRRRHDAESRAATHQSNEIALLAAQQQMRNEVRLLKVDLGRAAAVSHNIASARYAHQQQQQQLLLQFQYHGRDGRDIRVMNALSAPPVPTLSDTVVRESQLNAPYSLPPVSPPSANLTYDEGAMNAPFTMLDVSATTSAANRSLELFEPSVIRERRTRQAHTQRDGRPRKSNPAAGGGGSGDVTATVVQPAPTTDTDMQGPPSSISRRSTLPKQPPPRSDGAEGDEPYGSQGGDAAVYAAGQATAVGTHRNSATYTTSMATMSTVDASSDRQRMTSTTGSSSPSPRYAGSRSSSATAVAAAGADGGDERKGDAALAARHGHLGTGTSVGSSTGPRRLSFDDHYAPANSESISSRYQRADHIVGQPQPDPTLRPSVGSAGEDSLYNAQAPLSWAAHGTREGIVSDVDEATVEEEGSSHRHHWHRRSRHRHHRTRRSSHGNGDSSSSDGGRRSPSSVSDEANDMPQGRERLTYHSRRQVGATHMDTLAVPGVRIGHGEAAYMLGVLDSMESRLLLTKPTSVSVSQTSLPAHRK